MTEQGQQVEYLDRLHEINDALARLEENSETDLVSLANMSDVYIYAYATKALNQGLVTRLLDNQPELNTDTITAYENRIDELERYLRLIAGWTEGVVSSGNFDPSLEYEAGEGENQLSINLNEIELNIADFRQVLTECNPGEEAQEDLEAADDDLSEEDLDDLRHVEHDRSDRSFADAARNILDRRSPSGAEAEPSFVQRIIDAIKEWLSGSFLFGGLLRLIDRDNSNEDNDSLGLMSTEGMTVEELHELGRANPYMAWLIGNNAQSIDSLVARANEARDEFQGLTVGNYNFDAYEEYLDYPHNGGERCCSYYVSTCIGLGRDAVDSSGDHIRDDKLGSVTQGLAPFLIARNLEATGNTGIKVGFDNFRRGDAVFFLGNESYGAGRYGHTGLVRDIFEINGVRYMAMQHESADIRVEIIPIDDADNGRLSEVEEIYNNPAERNRHPVLASIAEYRSAHPETVRFTENRGYYGDSSQNGGNLAFAINTQAIRSGNSYNV